MSRPSEVSKSDCTLLPHLRPASLEALPVVGWVACTGRQHCSGCRSLPGSESVVFDERLAESIGVYGVADRAPILFRVEWSHLSLAFEAKDS